MNRDYPTYIIGEANELINLRNYLVNAINNPVLERDKINQLNNMLILLDRRITDLLLFENDKDISEAQQIPTLKGYLEFESIKKVIQEVRKTTDIKQGININNTKYDINI